MSQARLPYIDPPFPFCDDDLQQVKDTIKSSQNINKKYGTFEETMIHLAARRNLITIVKYLADIGADVNIPCKYGNSPLRDAVIRDFFDVAKCLVAHGADVNAVDKFGGSILHDAATHGDIDAITFLLDSGIDTAIKNNGGNTAMDIAFANGYHDAAACIKLYEQVPTKGVNM